MAAAERLQQPKAIRPSFVSQHSNSVPSTPAQHPRDIRFPSRSPSPSRGLSNHSPQSTTSETPYRKTAQRGQPVVCKFESGAEFRKRRIPYKDGGNEPLPAPEKEPKKTLTPDEDDKLSGDMRELYDRLLPSKESEERRATLIIKLETILNKEWPENDIKVNVFGSSGNLLSSDDSDVDVCITTPLHKLESMHSLATVLNDHGMEKVICRASAKVPIVKFWDPELQLACDMNVNNPLALENTRMIKTYVQIDDRVRPLAKIIKHWTKRRILNDAAFGGTISSYTWICMIINFLQSRNPPILPSLQRLPEAQRSTTNGQTSQFADDLDHVRGYGLPNKESLGQLLFSFFRYYGYEIDYLETVVSVKEGRALTRTEKGWQTNNYHDKEARSRLCVEEPFNTSRNLGNSADDYAFTGIHSEIRRAFDLISKGKLDESLLQYEFPPEEKTIFQRPAPKPKPVLTRSASQTGRPHAGSIGTKNNSRESRNNRNTSNNRNNSRRASSGASYGNSRLNFMSPPISVAGSDYFSTAAISTDQLHEQLYKQYQFLQQQQEALRNQLLQQQAVHAQAQANAQAQGQAYVTASPRQRQFAANGSPNPRMAPEMSAKMAPLLPGYLYHYPARYPPPASPLSQTRSNESNGVSSASPSHAATMPALRRGPNRSQIPDMTPTTSARSQSQPGRSLQNPMTVQSQAHPGFDTSGAIGTQYLLQQSLPIGPNQQNGLDLANHLYLNHAGVMPTDSPMPKEYVGYYLGQSPQLGPQYSLTTPHAGQILQAVPQTMRRLSPERLPPILPNGMRRQSRSPSPLSRGTSSPTESSNSRSAPLPQMPFPEALRKNSRVIDDGPVIVNGSLKSMALPAIVSSTRPTAKTEKIANGLGLAALDQDLHRNGHIVPGAEHVPRTVDIAQSFGHFELEKGSANRTKGDTILEASQPIIANSQSARINGSFLHDDNGLSSADQVAPQRVSPSMRSRAPARLNISPKEFTTAEASEHSERKKVCVTPVIPAPLLSPVAEMRTPSPTAKKIVPSPRNEALRISQVVNGSLNEKANAIIANGSINRPNLLSDHDGAENKPATSYVASHATDDRDGQWQQATRKGHKKGRSTGLAKTSTNGVKNFGEPLPANEADRKGG